MHSDSNVKYGRSKSVTEELRLSPLLPPPRRSSAAIYLALRILSKRAMIFPGSAKLLWKTSCHRNKPLCTSHAGKTGQAWSARQSPLPHPVNREGQARDSNSGVYLTRYGPSFQNAKPLITKGILCGCSPTKSSKISLEMSYSAGNISGPSIFLFIALSQKTHYEKPRFQIAHCGIKIGNCICENVH